MSINIQLALSGVDFNKVSMTLVDGLSIDILKIRYNWIFNAVIDDAILGEDDYGLVWYSGKWIDGEWYDGTWYSGDFMDGVWKNGNFYSYKLNKYDIVNGVFNIVDRNDSYSTIHKVEWLNGNFYGGTFNSLMNHDTPIDWSSYTLLDPDNPSIPNDLSNNTMLASIWRNGVFHNGIFTNSIWYNGIWKNGYMQNIQWIDGKFYNGEFNGHTWYAGVFLGGDFTSGVWYNGTFTMFDSNAISRFGATLDRSSVSKSETSYYTISDVITPNSTYRVKNTVNDKSWVDSETVMLSKLSIIPPSATTLSYSEYNTEQAATNIYTDLLIFKGFNFNIPDNSTIHGIEVNLSIYKDGGDSAGDYIRFDSVYISDRLDIIGYENKANNTNLPTYNNGDDYDYTASFGAEDETWGHEWTAEQLNNTDNFNLNLRFKMYKNGTENIRVAIAGVTITVYYTSYIYDYNYTKCIWKNGIFNNGEFHSGLYTDANGVSVVSTNHNYTRWDNGIFNNGRWYGGKFIDGVWNNGDFYGGVFGTDTTTPTWYNGVFYNGYWINGNFYGGEFHNGLAKNININGGNIGD